MAHSHHDPLNCVIYQPAFLPWLGFFDLVDQADIFVILDDVEFSRQSWQQRNRLRGSNGLMFLTAPVNSSRRSHQLIKDVELASEFSTSKLINTVKSNYARAPFFREYFTSFCESLYSGASTGKLADLNIALIKWFNRSLGISVPILRSSELKSGGKRGNYIANLCFETGARRYLSAAGAESYLIQDHLVFKELDISVFLHVYAHPEYRQCFNPFIPYASTLDLIFNTGSEALSIIRSGRRPLRPLGEPINKVLHKISKLVSRRFVFRVDASSEIGIGHLMRCQTLAERLSQRGNEIIFVSRSLPGFYKDLLLAQGYAVHVLPKLSNIKTDVEPTDPAHQSWLGAHWKKDAEQIISLILNIGFVDALIVDHYGIDSRWESTLRSHVGIICVIDDLADRPHECDLLIDTEFPVSTSADRYQNLVPSGCRTLFGPGYALLRPAFIDAAKVQLARDGKIRRCLIFYGGADTGNLTDLTLKALSPYLGPELEVQVIIGGVNPHAETLRSRWGGKPHIQLFNHVENMAELMTRADLAFGACGTTAWERCILGLPSLVVILADNQRPLTLALANIGVVENLGEASKVTSKIIADAFLRLTSDPVRYCAMSKAAKDVMLSKGSSIEAVLAEILPFVYRQMRLRYATMADAAELLEWRNQPIVRLNSIDQSVIKPDEHLRWLAEIIASPCQHLMIGYHDNQPVGVLRLDEKGDAGEISIYLTPQAHGRGYGSAILSAQEAWAIETLPNITRLIAVVKIENLKSHRLFIKQGYIKLVDYYEKRIAQ